MTIATIETAPLPDRMEYAKALAGASIIPKVFQQRPADVLVAIEYGNALGIAPIVALSEINVINGTPSLSASLMAALARQAGHKVRVTEKDGTVTCTIVRGDDPDFEHTASWNEKKARDAGLWGKGHWSKDAGTMLRWRAISECVRFACSEVLGGLKYTPEEVQDFAPQAAVPATHTVTQVQSLDDAVAEHRDVTERWEPTPEIPLRTDAQSKKLFAIMNKLDLGNRDEALALFSGWVGREIDSTKSLTVPEASMIIDRLSAMEAGADPDTGEVIDAEPEPEGGW